MSESNSTSSSTLSSAPNTAPVSTPQESGQTNASPAPTTESKGTPTTPAGKQAAAADAQATLSNPTATKAEKTAAKKMLKQLSLKVDGQELVEDLPFEIPDDPKVKEWMTRELQMAKMGQKRAQEKSLLEKDVTKLIEKMKTDPFSVLTDPLIGHQADKIIEAYLNKQIEQSKKSPEQLELERVKEELRLERERQLQEKQLREEAERQALAEKYATDYEKQMDEALEKNQIPKSPAALQKIIDYMKIAVDANKEVSIADIIPFVSEELKGDYLSHLASLPDDALEEFFPKELYERMRKVAVKKAKAAQANPAVKAPTQAASTGKTSKDEQSKEEDKKISFKDYFSRF